MKLFIPAVGYRIKLTQDWSFTLFAERRNQTMFDAGGLSYEDFSSSWLAPLRGVGTVVVAGTVLEVDRVYVRTVNKAKVEGADDDFDSVTFKVVRPDNKKVRFWAKLADVNNIEYELPSDHAAGKTEAVERAKKPKKLDPSKIKSVVLHGINAYVANLKSRKVSYYGPTPAWMTKDAVTQMKQLEAEYFRLREPYERAKFEANRTKARAELERKLATGELSLPIGLAGKIKTIDDMRKYGVLYHDIDSKFEMRNTTWSYIVPYEVMAQCGYSGRSSFERMSDGTCARTFRPDPSPSSGWEADAPDVSHMWVKVFTDTHDLEVVKVEAGVDELKGP